MLDLSEVPVEILATVFAIGILTWDIRFLPPLRLVCRVWNDIIMTTPRLWGIITIDKGSDPAQLATQITIAKHSPLSVFVGRPKSIHNQALVMLVNLSLNWVNADVSTSILKLARWADLHGKLETLRLKSTGRSLENQAEIFFDAQGTMLGKPRLRFFAAHGLSEDWLLPFLTPSIKSFEFHPRVGLKLSTTLTYLSKAPQISSLILSGVQHTDYQVPQGIKHLVLAHLTTLELHLVLYPTSILCELVVPSLQTLIIKDPPVLKWSWTQQHLNRPELQPLAPLFIAWSQHNTLPIHLRSLTLAHCLEVSDVFFLIRWLARLPSITSLSLHDDDNAIARAAELPESNLLNALASPDGAGTVGGWLCPDLTRIQLVGSDLEVVNLLPLLRARGSHSAISSNSQTPPSLIHYVDAFICPNGSCEDIQEMTGLVDAVVCACLGCQFNLSI